MDPELYEVLKKEFPQNSEHRRQMQVAEAQDRKTLVGALSRNDTLGLVFSWTFAVGCVGIAVYFIIWTQTAPIAGIRWVERPKGLWRATFTRLMDAAEAYDNAAIDVSLAGLTPAEALVWRDDAK
jgi:hypothetical protein